MNEYIVRESGYPGTIKTEIVSELVRCKECSHKGKDMDCWVNHRFVTDDFFCGSGERREDGNQKV